MIFILLYPGHHRSWAWRYQGLPYTLRPCLPGPANASLTMETYQLIKSTFIIYTAVGAHSSSWANHTQEGTPVGLRGSLQSTVLHKWCPSCSIPGGTRNELEGTTKVFPLIHTHTMSSWSCKGRTKAPLISYGPDPTDFTRVKLAMSKPPQLMSTNEDGKVVKTMLLEELSHTRFISGADTADLLNHGTIITAQFVASIRGHMTCLSCVQQGASNVWAE